MGYITLTQQLSKRLVFPQRNEFRTGTAPAKGRAPNTAKHPASNPVPELEALVPYSRPTTRLLPTLSASCLSGNFRFHISCGDMQLAMLRNKNTHTPYPCIHYLS